MIDIQAFYRRTLLWAGLVLLLLLMLAASLAPLAVKYLMRATGLAEVR